MDIEGRLKEKGNIKSWQLQEIKKMFNMIDTEGNGNIIPAGMHQFLTKIYKGAVVTEPEILVIFQKITGGLVPTISYEQFLQSIYNWLSSSNTLAITASDSDDSCFPYEKEILHKNMINFFLQFKHGVLNVSGIELEYLHSLRLEDRSETWDYLAQGLSLSNEEKWKLYQESCDLLNNFASIAAAINSTVPGSILEGCRQLVRLLNILSVVTSPQERFEIASHLLRLFDLLINSNVILRVIGLLGAVSEPYIQWEATKIITFFVPGPRIAHTPQESAFHPSKMTTKLLVINNGVVQKLIELQSKIYY